MIPYHFHKKVHIEQLPKLKKSQKISVIIVSYNSEKYIKQCLDSVIKSSIPLEIIVIDNASTDNTLQILKIYEDKIKLIKSTQNLGFGGGNNLGIKNSSGDILILINPDAYVEKNSIEQLIEPMLYDERVMITGPKIFYPDSKKIQSAGGVLLSNALPYHIGYGQKDDPIFNTLITVDYVTGAAMAIKRTLFEITGLFDPVYNPAYYEETEKCVQARKLGFKVLYVPESVVYHYESTTLTALSKKFLKLFHTNRFKFIYRNFGFFEYMRFLYSETKWFFLNCGFDEKKLVANAHFKIIFSPVKLKHKITLDKID